MPYQIIHFREAERILKEKNLERDLEFTLCYLDDILYGAGHKRELLKLCMEEMDWLNKDDMKILEGRRYSYRGFKRGVAVESALGMYEFIQTALLRLQIGFDKKLIDMGIILVNADRSDKSPLGTTKELVEKEIKMLHPTISLPVSVALFNLGNPDEYMEALLKKDGPVPEENTIPTIPAIPNKPVGDLKILHMNHNQPDKRRKSNNVIPRSNQSRKAEKESISAAI